MNRKIRQLDQLSRSEDLFLNFKKLSDNDIKYICQNIRINPKSLRMSSNGITHLGLDSFSKVNWNNIIYLDISFNPIGAAGCKHISRASLASLTQIVMNNCSIDAVAIQHLYKVNFPKLNDLNLKGNKITTNAFQYFVRGNWPKLTTLSLENISYFSILLYLISKLHLKDSNFRDLAPYLQGERQRYQQMEKRRSG